MKAVRALVFGDSHVGTLYRVHTHNDVSYARARRLSLDFVAAAGPVTALLEIAGSALSLKPRPDRWQHGAVADETIGGWYDTTANQIRSISGSDRVDLGGYDCLVILGGHVMAHWHSVLAAARSGHYSSACVRQTCMDIVRGTRHARWLEQVALAGLSDLRVFTVAEPLRNASAPDFPKFYAGLRVQGVQMSYEDVIRAMGAELIAQPSALLNPEGNATHAEFKSANGGDFTHLNTEGAKILFREVVDRLIASA